MGYFFCTFAAVIAIVLTITINLLNVMKRVEVFKIAFRSFIYHVYAYDLGEGCFEYQAFRGRRRFRIVSPSRCASVVIADLLDEVLPRVRVTSIDKVDV